MCTILALRYKDLSSLTSIRWQIWQIRFKMVPSVPLLARCLIRAGVLPALVALSIGAGLPNRTKDAYVCHIEFDDSKSAILLQLSKHKYQQF